MIEKDHLGDWSPEKDSNKMIFFNQGIIIIIKFVITIIISVIFS